MQMLKVTSSLIDMTAARLRNEALVSKDIADFLPMLQASLQNGYQFLLDGIDVPNKAAWLANVTSIIQAPIELDSTIQSIISNPIVYGGSDGARTLVCCAMHF